MSKPWAAERIEQPTAGYASDVTTISASTSQLDLSDTSRPSLSLTRNRTSQTGGKRARSGLRAGATEEDLLMDRAEAANLGLGLRSNNVWQMNMTPQTTDLDPIPSSKDKLAATFEKTSRGLYDDTTGSTSSAIQPNSSDTPASHHESESDNDNRQLLYSEPTFTSQSSERPVRRTGLDRIWTWISSTAAPAGSDEYRLVETGVSAKGDGDVKGKHGNASRRKRTKRSRDVRGRLVETDLGGHVHKRIWRRLGVLVTTRPYRSLLIFLVVLGLFAYTLTKFLMYALNPDKAPLPWRQYCASQQPSYHALKRSPTRRSSILARITEGFTSPSKQPLVEIDSSHPAWPWGPSNAKPPHSAEDDSVDQLEPVGIFIGIMTMDKSREKRMLIRQTYGSHPKSRVRGTEGVSVRFIMGRPKEKYAQEVELENDTFGDIVILDMEENMNSGKTHKYFTWAADHATVPEYSFVLPSTSQHPSHRDLDMEDINLESGYQDEVGHTVRSTSRPPNFISLDPAAHAVYMGEKRPDYIFKADDDALIVLGEFERRVRVAPRKLTFFGYLVKNSFMGGECYGMSHDLVRYVADYEPLRKMVKGKEDKLATKWIKMHPQREDVVWVSERCAIYDHPKAGTVYSHGFLFPNTIDEVRSEDTEQMTPLELQWRGGKHWAATYSTVSRFGSPYAPPFEHMTALQQVEALVEGSEMSLFSRLHAAKHPNAQSIPLWKSDADDAALAAKTYERRPSRQVRFRNDPKERGGTMVVHFIKHESWFLETALALLGPSNTTVL